MASPRTCPPPRGPGARRLSRPQQAPAGAPVAASGPQLSPCWGSGRRKELAQAPPHGRRVMFPWEPTPSRWPPMKGTGEAEQKGDRSLGVEQSQPEFGCHVIKCRIVYETEPLHSRTRRLRRWPASRRVPRDLNLPGALLDAPPTGSVVQAVVCHRLYWRHKASASGTP